MTLIAHATDFVDFLRPPTGRCLGAVFSSYDFDEAFFESVLASLLPIHADPDTDPDRFVDEGRRRLRETPVCVLVDGHRARGGHRLPFDLVKASATIAFHAKLALTLFADQARLMIGSANLTEGGYGGNAELVAQLVLDYDRDGALLASVLQLMTASGMRGEAWERLQAQLALLCGEKARGPSPLLQSQKDRSVFDQLIARLPKKTKIDGVSLLLGVQPEDDPVAETHLLDELLDRLAKANKRLPPIEVGLPWEGNAVAPPTDAPPPTLESLFGKLCARLVTTAGQRSLEHFVPLRAEGADVICQNGARIAKRKLKEELAEAPPRLWLVPEIVAVGPVAPLERLFERASVQIFAFPELRLDGGQVFHRALHAKLIAVRTTEGKKKRTHLLIGAPSFERFADEANTVMEAALHDVRAGHLMIEALAPELVPAPVEQLYLQNRPLPAPQAQHLCPLESAIYDARTRTLQLSFRPGTRTLNVMYQSGEQELELIEGEPHLNESFPDFPLDRHSSELTVSVQDDRWLVPIAFHHLAELVCDEDARTAAASNADELPQDGPAPGHVFRSIAALIDEIKHAGVSLGAFSVAMRGPNGLLRFAERWTIEAQADDGVDRSEAWLYGQELARALRQLRFGKDASGRHRERELKAFLTTLEARLNAIAARAAYVKSIDRFYRT